MTDLLTNSRIKAARACLRLHYLQYDLGYRSTKDAEALRFGSLVHLGLEAWWRAADGERLGAALQAVQAANPGPFDLAKARVMLAGYDVRWGAEPYEVVAVEAQFETDLLNPDTGEPSQDWRIAGKIDAIVRDRRDGQLRIVEHKTSASDTTPGSTYFQQLRLDSQISIYFRGSEALGFPVVSCVYDVLGKPQIKPLKATPAESRKYKKDGTLYASQREADETPEEFEARLIEAIGSDPSRYFQRAEIVRLEDELRDHEVELWEQAEILRASRAVGMAPKNPDSCFRYGRECQFFQACCKQRSLDDESMFVRAINVHPELEAFDGSAD